MTNSPVKYKFLFSVSDMNKCPASFFMTVCILSHVQTYWAAEEMLSTMALRYPQSSSGTATDFSPSLGKFSTECLTKGIGSCCLFPSQVSVQDRCECLHVPDSEKWYVLFEDYPCWRTTSSERFITCSNNEKHPEAQEWRRQSQMPCTDIRLQEYFWLFKFIVDRK